MPKKTSSSDFYNLLQGTLLLIAVSVLLFYSILEGTNATVGEISTLLPILAIVIVIMSLAMSTSFIPLGRITYATFLALIAMFMMLTFLLLASEQLEVRSVTSFIVSTLTYMVLGLLAAVALAFAATGKTPFIAWGPTKLWREVFFVGVALWFVLLMTTYLNLAPFSAAPFLGVPFNTQDAAFNSPLTDATVRGLAGYIEGNFFFTFLLGFLTALGVSKLFPKDNVIGRLIAVGIVAAIFAAIIALLHTGMHDISQLDVLWFIGLFFFAGALTTLYFGTSFSFTIAQFILDFVNALFSSLLPQYINLGWWVVFGVSAIAMFGLIMWHPWRK
jgi:hypothetical protein